MPPAAWWLWSSIRDSQMRFAVDSAPPLPSRSSIWTRPSVWADRILILAGGRIVAEGSSDQLAALVTRETRVRWRQNGEPHAALTRDAVRFLRELLDGSTDEITDLDVRRSTLEDTYLALVQGHESGRGDEAAAFEEAEV